MVVYCLMAWRAGAERVGGCMDKAAPRVCDPGRDDVDPGGSVLLLAPEEVCVNIINLYIQTPRSRPSNHREIPEIPIFATIESVITKL